MNLLQTYSFILLSLLSLILFPSRVGRRSGRSIPFCSGTPLQDSDKDGVGPLDRGKSARQEKIKRKCKNGIRVVDICVPCERLDFKYPEAFLEARVNEVDTIGGT